MADEISTIKELEDAWDTYLRTISALRYKYKHIDSLASVSFDTLYKATWRAMENDFDLHPASRIREKTKKMREFYAID